MILESFDLICRVVCKILKTDFQDGCSGAYPRFPIGTILAIFDLKVIHCFAIV